MWRVYLMSDIAKFKERLAEFEKENRGIYDYSDDFSQTIAMVLESIISAYGEEYESIVFEAVKSCKYVVHDSPERIISSYKNMNGEYSSNANIEKSEDGFSISSVERMITLPNTFNTESPAHIGMLVRETLRLVRSYLNEYTIDGNILKERRGLETREYKIFQNGNIREISRVGNGLEEGIIFYDELAIMWENYSDSYEPINGKDYQRIIAGLLEGNSELKSTMIRGALIGSTLELESSLGVEYNEFISLIDGLDKLEEKRKEKITSTKGLNLATDKLAEYYEQQVVPIINSLNINLTEINEEKKSVSF